MNQMNVSKWINLSLLLIVSFLLAVVESVGQSSLLPLTQGKITYEVLETRYQPQQVFPGMYNPNLPADQIEKWTKAQSLKRKQSKTITLHFSPDTLQYEMKADAGEIFSEAVHQILHIDLKNNDAAVLFFQPLLHKVELVEPEVGLRYPLLEHYSDYITPEELMGTALIPASMLNQSTQIDKQSKSGEQEASSIVSYKDLKSDYVFGEFELNPFLKVIKGDYHISKERTRAIEYTHYENRNGIDFPKSFTVEDYAFSKIKEHTPENHIATNVVKIHAIETSPEFIDISQY